VRKIFLLESSSRGRFFLSVPLFVWRSLRLLRPVVLPAFHFLPLSIVSRRIWAPVLGVCRWQQVAA
jgi:hypothetical protein